jgi:hypothetical protein
MTSLVRLLGSALAAAGMGLLFAASPAAAECNPDTALFSDDFEEFLDATWGDADEGMQVADGVLVVKSYRGQVNFATTGKDLNACMDMTIVEAPDQEYTSGGFIFWWTDWDNYYYMNYWPNGLVNISRVVKGKTMFLIDANPTNIKKGLGQTNSLEIDLKGKTATLLVNGAVASRFKGIPPKDGGPIGFVAYGAEGKPSTFKIDNFVVSEPDQAAQPAPAQ